MKNDFIIALIGVRNLFSFPKKKDAIAYETLIKKPLFYKKENLTDEYFLLSEIESTHDDLKLTFQYIYKVIVLRKKANYLDFLNQLFRDSRAHALYIRKSKDFNLDWFFKKMILSAESPFLLKRVDFLFFVKSVEHHLSQNEMVDFAGYNKSG
jgi:hypothetical protein